VKENPSLVELLDEEETDPEVFGEEIDQIDIDKAWHGIHFLLTGSADEAPPPLGDAVLGGTALLVSDDMDWRYLTPEEVRDVAHALSDITAEHLERRYDPRAMEKADIYPNIWERDGSEALEYLTFYYNELALFYKQAALQGKAALISIG
jgi:hypothetical protein